MKNPNTELGLQVWMRLTKMHESWLRENSEIILVLYSQLLTEINSSGLSKFVNYPELGDFAMFVYHNSA